MGEQGMALREGQQYHWENRGYATFDDFLAALSSGRRKTIRRERREAVDGLEICCITGEELGEEHWDAFFGFYMDTGSRKWGRPYLTRPFFSLVGERMADRVLLIMARRNGRWIAGALNLIGDDCLYGRNWGCVEDVPFLHFELCYYQAIEWAIDRGLARVEAGAQGQHKIARGYLPRPVYSAHYIADPALRGPVERFVAQEREGVEQEMEWLAEEYSPFRQGRLGLLPSLIQQGGHGGVDLGRAVQWQLGPQPLGPAFVLGLGKPRIGVGRHCQAEHRFAALDRFDRGELELAAERGEGLALAGDGVGEGPWPASRRPRKSRATPDPSKGLRARLADCPSRRSMGTRPRARGRSG
jgi:hypothetical protein